MLPCFCLKPIPPFSSPPQSPTSLEKHTTKGCPHGPISEDRVRHTQETDGSNTSLQQFVLSSLSWPSNLRTLASPGLKSQNTLNHKWQKRTWLRDDALCSQGCYEVINCSNLLEMAMDWPENHPLIAGWTSLVNCITRRHALTQPNTQFQSCFFQEAFSAHF